VVWDVLGIGDHWEILLIYYLLRQKTADLRPVQGRPDLHFVSIFTDDAFWRVSADTKTCGSPLNLSPTGGLR